MRRTTENYDGGISVNGRRISNLRYADDTAIFAENIEDLERIMLQLQRESELLRVTIIDRADNNQRDITKVFNCEVVDKFTYLGSLITNYGSCELEIWQRTEIARHAVLKLTKILHDCDMSKTTKIRLLHSLVFSMLLQAAEA